MTDLSLQLYKFNSLDVYGPKIWYLIHLFALGYVEREHLLYHPYQAFIISIKELFPCKICKEHFSENLYKYKLENNYATLFHWSYLLHNEVNKMKNKSSPSYRSSLDSISKHLHTWDVVPNLFFVLFTIIKYSGVSDKMGYFIMLLTSLKYLIPIDIIKKVYTQALEKYSTVDPLSVTVLYWTYLIYKDVHENLSIHYHTYGVIVEYFS